MEFSSSATCEVSQGQRGEATWPDLLRTETTRRGGMLLFDDETSQWNNIELLKD